MARAYIDGKTVIVFIKRINKIPAETTFRGLACLDSNSFSGTREKKVVKNKCTGNWEDGIAGNGNWQIQASGQAISDVVALSEANYQELSEIWAAGEVVEMKAANVDGSYYRGGTGMITDFSEDANSEDPLSFEITLSGFGVPVMKKPVV